MHTELSCPIPRTHTRLEQSHLLWHQTHSSYNDPDYFQTNLNATIESFRNVTFMLQSEKHKFGDFEAWYNPWQEKMKSDSIMKWLNTARTTVVHKSDLETKSIARAVVHNNLNLANIEFDLPPFVPIPLACSIISANLPEPLINQKEYLIISIERSWCVSELPNHELLDALSYAFAFLWAMVQDAHRHLNRVCETRDHDGKLIEHVDGRMLCMAVAKSTRTSRISLKDGTEFTPEVIPFDLNVDIAKKASKRYKMDEIPDHSKEGNDPFTMAESLIPLSKNILQKDKNHSRTMFLRKPQGWMISSIQAKDRLEKYALMRDIAEEIRRSKIDAIIDIGESWLSSVKEFKLGRMPEDAHDRKEALITTVATSSGQHRSYIIPFKRTFLGKIIFEETSIDESTIPSYLAPIFEVWGIPMSLPKQDKTAS